MNFNCFFPDTLTQIFANSVNMHKTSNINNKNIYIIWLLQSRFFCAFDYEKWIQLSFPSSYDFWDAHIKINDGFYTHFNPSQYTHGVQISKTVNVRGTISLGNSFSVSSNLVIHLPCDPDVSLLGIYPKEEKKCVSIETHMFIIALLLELKSSLTDEWINSLRYSHTVESYLTI